jgi:colicin import membrane protein
MSASHSSTNESRKAEKKLREIDKLKLQSAHTHEEIEKLKTETYYRRIVNPLYKSEEEKREEILHAEHKRKEAEELKKRQYARHLEKEKQRQQKNEKEREKREKEQEKEREKRSKSYYERGKKYQFDFDIKPQVKQLTSLEIEYYETS